MKLINRVELFRSEAIDFLASMFRLNNNDYMTKNPEYIPNKPKPDDEIIKWVQETEKKLPKDIKNKLELFFNWETFFGMCLVSKIIVNDIKTIEKAIEWLKDLSHNKILEAFIGTGYTLEEGDNAKEIITNLLNDEKKAIEFINTNTLIPSQQKWEMLQFFIDPEQMKKDLIELLSWYYKNIYVFEVEKVMDVVSKYEKNLEKKIKKYGYDYLKLLTNEDYAKNKEKIFLAVSYYYEFASLSSGNSELDANIYMFGFRYEEVFIKNKHALLSNVQMFKALGDETRLNMVKLLSQRPWYGKEIAKKLNLSNSTVSHHLSLLTLNGFVTTEKVDNRTYYSLNIDNMKEIIITSIDKMMDL